MAPRKSPVLKKKQEQAELKALNQIQITIEASEGNLQRIAALLNFADWPVEHVKLVPQEMPWEEPGSVPPKIEIDRLTLERAATPLLERYVEQHGREKTKELVASFGAERLKLLTDEQLLGLHNVLAELEAAGA